MRSRTSRTKPFVLFAKDKSDCQSDLSKPLSILYKNYFLKDSFKRKATKFIEKIRISALKQIDSKTSWMEDETKKKAKKKVKDMILSIGWPDSYPKFKLPLLQTDNLLENIYLLSSNSTDEDISLFYKKTGIPGKFWDEPSYIVNAFYYNEINEFIVPAGSLFYPFFGSTKSKGWNYGGLGCVIGHEMIHAFDDDGKDYDEHGYYNPWWQPRDNRRFHVMSKKLIDLYNNSTIFGIHMNGKLTLNENIADLGGISIALEALKDEIKFMSEKEKKYELQQFFLSYAVSWRTKEEKQKVLQGFILDRHSPAELRVNNIVSQIDEWYDAFDIKVEDLLYIAPEDRIKIF